MEKEDTAEEFSFRRVFLKKGILKYKKIGIKNSLQTIRNYVIIIPDISGNLKF